MQWDVLMAGSGGQGVMLIGQLLATAALFEGKYASCLPSYGPEKVGGSADCTTVISAEPIVTPVIDKPNYVVALNQFSYLKFKSLVAPGGTLIVNSSLVTLVHSNTDNYNVISLPFTDHAKELGSERSANFVALGAFIKLSRAIAPDSLIAVLTRQFKSKPNLADLNEQAFCLGMAQIS